MSAFTVVADPPWPERGGGKSKRGADRHYKVMTTKAITEHMREHVPSTCCALWMWTTTLSLRRAFTVAEAIGFAYVTSRPWIKYKPSTKKLPRRRANGLGQHIRCGHEFILLFKRGRVPVPPPPLRFPSPIDADVGRHSQKPQIVYDQIRAAYPGPFLEMFAVDAREGWEQHGDRSWMK